MKIIVTGADGFVGTHLLKDLDANGHAPFGLGRRHLPHTRSCDICDKTALINHFKAIKPDAAIHLAGISTADTRRPEEITALAHVNITGTLNICEAAVASGCSLLLYVSSGLVYQPSPGHHRFKETDPATSMMPYSLSKLGAEQVVKLFSHLEPLKIYIARPFNHIGVGQSPKFVVPALAHQIASAPSGGSIEVGNLNSYRDFTDVRDMVRAYRLILEKQPDPHAFVLGSGRPIRIHSLLEQLIAISGKHIQYHVQPDLLRQSEVPTISADSSLAEAALGWRPEISLTETLTWIYENIRARK